MTPEDRYFRDPMFRSLVEMMIHHIRAANYTPAEMREAALLASIIYEMNTVRPRFEKMRVDIL